MDEKPVENAADTALIAGRKKMEQHYWLWILCILGLDYFSTLAYQPSITYSVAGLLGPVATAVVVLVTLFAALPVYCYLAGRSFDGEGGIGLLERQIHGWRGKTAVLILLGFAATDFTLLKSISMADASVHLLNAHDEYRRSAFHAFLVWLTDQVSLWFGASMHPYFDEQLIVTLIISVVGFFFWFLLRRGFNRNVMLIAVPLVFTYLAMTGAILWGGGQKLYENPDILSAWIEKIHAGEWGVRQPQWVHDGWAVVWLVSFWFLPNLALGLSGFELSMILMPQVKGGYGESSDHPRTRIWNTRKVLILAALIMSVYLLGSVLVTTLLIPPEEFAPEGNAANRALAYLAHGGRLTITDDAVLPCCGVWFGTAYDFVTILMLAMAGTSVVTALGVLMPQVLLRYGMEFRWTQKWGVLLGMFALMNITVTMVFQAHVEDQRSAYATGVLVLITTACVSSYLDVYRQQQEQQRAGFLGWLGRNYFRLVAILFLLILLGVMARSLSGLALATLFIVAILLMSVVSRAFRANEIRTVGFVFADERSKFLWDSLKNADFPALIPHRPGLIDKVERERRIREDHQLSPAADVVFLEVAVDDPSNFYQRLHIEIVAEQNRYTIKVTRCVSVSHAIAAIALEMSRESKPPGLHFGWSELDILSASWNYLAFGEGNIPAKVRELVLMNEKDPAKRPRVIVG